jgi:hypothetical protein
LHAHSSGAGGYDEGGNQFIHVATEGDYSGAIGESGPGGPVVLSQGLLDLPLNALALLGQFGRYRLIYDRLADSDNRQWTA